MKKILLLLLLTINFISVYAQTMPAPPSPTGLGPGAPDIPVDMFVYPLLAVAALLIARFAKQVNLTK
jgi:hypothetical protein